MITPAGLIRRFLYGPAADPACAPEPEKLNCNIRTNILQGIFNAATLDMVNPFTGIFAIKLGATKLQVALLSSLPAAISLLAMIPGARFIDRRSRKKRLTFLFMLAHRIFFLGIACIPFFQPTWRAALFVAIIGVMNLPGSIANIAWQSFISTIIPAERRAEAFAHRNRAMNFVGTMLALGAGFVLDHLAFPVGYQVVFAIAFLLAMVELQIFNRVEEPRCDGPRDPEAGTAAERSPQSESGMAPDQGAAPEGSIGAAKPPPDAGGKSTRAPGVSQKLAAHFSEIMAQPRFLRYTAASVLFYFAWPLAWPLFSWYQVKVLAANNFWVSLLSLMNTGGSLIGYGFWVRVLNRHGNLKTLFYSTLPIFIVPLVYAFSRSLYVVVAFNLITGAIFSGVNLALFNALLEVTPETNKTSYIAYYNTCITISQIIAPLVGVGLLNIMSFQWAFIVCAIFRILGSFCFLVVNRMEVRQRRAG